MSFLNSSTTNFSINRISLDCYRVWAGNREPVCLTVVGCVMRHCARYLKNVFLLSLFLVSTLATGREIYGFKLDDALISATQIFSGGPDKR